MPPPTKYNKLSKFEVEDSCQNDGLDFAEPTKTSITVSNTTCKSTSVLRVLGALTLFLIVMLCTYFVLSLRFAAAGIDNGNADESNGDSYEYDDQYFDIYTELRQRKCFGLSPVGCLHTFMELTHLNSSLNIFKKEQEKEAVCSDDLRSMMHTGDSPQIDGELYTYFDMLACATTSPDSDHDKDDYEDDYADSFHSFGINLFHSVLQRDCEGNNCSLLPVVFDDLIRLLWHPFTTPVMHTFAAGIAVNSFESDRENCEYSKSRKSNEKKSL